MSELIKRIYTSAVLLPLTLGALLYAPQWLLASIIMCILLIILTTEWPKLFCYKSLSFWALMPFYPIAPFLALIALLTLSRTLVLFLLITVVAHDVGSYCAGKLWGKHTIIPQISPGKTWEGFIGGYCATLLATISFVYLKTGHAQYITLLFLAALISTTALIGDLWQSYLKRRVGLKDSGSLLPGHGGLLDRLDALMFVALLFYILRAPLYYLFAA